MKPLNDSRRYTFGSRHGGDFIGKPREERPVALLGEKIGDTLVGDRRCEELCAVDHLGPEIAPDVSGQDRIAIEKREQPVQRADALGLLAVDLTDYDSAAPGIVDDARSLM